MKGAHMGPNGGRPVTLPPKEITIRLTGSQRRCLKYLADELGLDAGPLLEWPDLIVVLLVTTAWTMAETVSYEPTEAKP